MKRFKFTFGFVLSLLLLGASWNGAGAQVSVPNDIALKFGIVPSPYYLVDTIVTPWLHGPEYNLGVLYNLFVKDQKGNLVEDVAFNQKTTIGGIDYWYYAVANPIASTSVGDWREEFLGWNAPTQWYSAGDKVIKKADIAKIINAGYDLNFDIEINLTYVDGKLAYPFLKRYLTYKNSKGEVTTQSFLVAPYVAPNKGQWFRPNWTYGSGVATYQYSTAISDLLDQYQITEIAYEVWVSEDLTDDPFSTPKDNRAITLVTDETDISVKPYYFDQTFYVPSGQDFTFVVTANPDKKLTATIPSNPNYMANKGIEIVEALEKDGTWNVTLRKLSFNVDELILGYETSTEGGNPSGLVAPAVDKVYSAGGVLNVTSSTPATLQVYTITGQLAKEIAVSGDTQVPLSKGLYLVKLNGKAYKVVL